MFEWMFEQVANVQISATNVQCRGSPRVAEVSLFQVAEAPTDMYYYRIPFLNLI